MNGKIKIDEARKNQPDLFGETRAEFADDIVPVMKKLFELSGTAYGAVFNARMDESFGKKDLLLYAEKVLGAALEAEQGNGQTPRKTDTQPAVRNAAEKAALDRSDPLVRAVLDSAGRVAHEIHRIMGFLRFNPDANGLWLARCAPDNAILPVLADHFMLRFGDAPWAIIDEKRGSALVRLAGQDAVFGPLSQFPFLESPGTPKDEWEELWRGYHRTVSIENRKNPGLQAQLMPRRYWKYLPEVNPRP